MPFMIARIQLRYGGEALATFNEGLAALLPAFEEQGWKLVGAYVNAIGTLNEVWDIWEVDDANHIMDARMGVRSVPGVGDWAKRLSEVIVSEQLHYVEKLPYSA
jgi:hypothetical protein